MKTIGDCSLSIVCLTKQEICLKNTENRMKQLYTHTGGSKSIARRKDEEEKIKNIEDHDSSSKEISTNDSLSQALGKEHSGRVRGVGAGPCPTRLFGQTTHHLGESSQASAIQSEMNEVKSQLEAERLKRKNLEEIVEAERLKRLVVENVVKYILQLQGGTLPPELAAMIYSASQDEGSGPISPGARPSSSASHDAQHQCNQNAN